MIVIKFAIMTPVMTPSKDFPVSRLTIVLLAQSKPLMAPCGLLEFAIYIYG